MDHHTTVGFEDDWYGDYTGGSHVLILMQVVVIIL
jgi:hypothetical protein